MHTLSDAIRLREAILAERRAKTVTTDSNTIVFVAPEAKRSVAPAPKPSGFLARLREIACL